MRKLLVAIFFSVAAIPAANAQSTCPSIIYGAVLTAAQWNACFSSKQDVLGFSPVNKAGDTMSGKLTTPSTTGTQAGFNLTPGGTPSAPLNGDLWATSVGLYVRINGTTIGPLVDSSGVVTSVFGRTGAVTAQSGDYAVADVTGSAPLASPTFTGTPAAPTATPGTNTTQIATTAFVNASFAPLASPSFTGTPTAPTNSSNSNNTTIPTEAWVNNWFLLQSTAASTYSQGALKASFSANKNGTNQTGIASNSWTQLTFSTTGYDVGSYFATNAWTPPAGKVHLDAHYYATGTITAGALCAIAIFRDGVLFAQNSFSEITNSCGGNISIDTLASGSNVYTVWVYLNVSGTATVDGTSTQTSFSGHFID